MNKKEIMKMLCSRIGSCLGSLISAREENFSKIHIEGFRCRLDELILVYQIIRHISFLEACEELGVNYKDVNVGTGEAEEQE